jgi:predicted KAP-like P-loop ATPase
VFLVFLTFFFVLFSKTHFSKAGVSGHIQNAEATVNLVRRRADVSIEVWMQDSTAITRGIGQAAEAVQRAEESVEDEAGKKDRKKKVRDKMKVCVSALQMIATSSVER